MTMNVGFNIATNVGIAICCLLFAVRYLLLAIRCLPVDVCQLLFAICCLLFAVCCLLLAVSIWNIICMSRFSQILHVSCFSRLSCFSDTCVFWRWIPKSISINGTPACSKGIMCLRKADTANLPMAGNSLLAANLPNSPKIPMELAMFHMFLHVFTCVL